MTKDSNLQVEIEAPAEIDLPKPEAVVANHTFERNETEQPQQLPMYVYFAGQDGEYPTVIMKFNRMQPFLRSRSTIPMWAGESNAPLNVSAENREARDYGLIRAATRQISSKFHKEHTSLQNKPVGSLKPGLLALDQQFDTLYLEKKSVVMKSLLTNYDSPKVAKRYEKVKAEAIEARVQRIQKLDSSKPEKTLSHNQRIATLAAEILNIAWEYDVPYNDVLKVYATEKYRDHKWFKMHKQDDQLLIGYLAFIDRKVKEYVANTHIGVVGYKENSRITASLPPYNLNDSLLNHLRLWTDERFIKLYARHLADAHPNKKSTIYRLVYALKNPVVKPVCLQRARPRK